MAKTNLPKDRTCEPENLDSTVHAKRYDRNGSLERTSEGARQKTVLANALEPQAGNGTSKAV